MKIIPYALAGLLLLTVVEMVWAGAAPDIKVNGVEGPIAVSSGNTVSVTVSLDPEDQAGQVADWWIYVDASIGTYSWVFPSGWQYGDYISLQYSLIELPDYNILNMKLPTGSYTFYFAVDNNSDGNKDETWQDSTSIIVNNFTRDQNIDPINPGSYEVGCTNFEIDDTKLSEIVSQGRNLGQYLTGDSVAGEQLYVSTLLANTNDTFTSNVTVPDEIRKEKTD